MVIRAEMSGTKNRSFCFKRCNSTEGSADQRRDSNAIGGKHIKGRHNNIPVTEGSYTSIPSGVSDTLYIF